MARGTQAFGLALGAAAFAAGCGDLFHSTDWPTRCAGQPSLPECGGAGGSTASGTGGSSGDAGGGGGQPPACKPGAVEACAYSGPDGTEGVGFCKAGSKTCRDDGAGYGPCEGEVLPRSQDCATEEDETCGLAAGPCAGTPASAFSFGGPSADYAYAVATDAQGNVLVSGMFRDSIEIGPDVITSAGTFDAFVTKLTPNFDVLWSRAYQTASHDVAFAVAPTSDGGVVVAACGADDGDFGGGVLGTTGAAVLILARLDANGSHVWSRAYAVPCQAGAHPLAVAPDGTIAFAGAVAGTVDLSAGVEIVGDDAGDGFIVRLDPSGEPATVNILPGPGAQRVTALALDDEGRLYAGGASEGDVALGSGVKSSRGFFLLRYGAGGELDYAVPGTVAITSSTIVDAIAPGTKGELWASIAFSESVTVDGTAHAGTNAYNPLLLRIGTDGAVSHARVLASPGHARVYGLDVDSAGQAIAAGTFTSSISLAAPSGLLKGTSAEAEGFVTKMGTSEGAFVVQWAHAFGSQLADYAIAAKLDSVGGAVVAGSAGPGALLGESALSSAGDLDVFVARLKP